MIDMQRVKEFGLPFMDAHILPVWEEATSKEQPSWMLPILVCECLGGAAKSNIAADWQTATVAALGCTQLSIIVVDDMLDYDERGLHKRVGAGQAANIALGFQSVAQSMFDGYGYEPYALARMGRYISRGQYMDVNNDILDEAIYWSIVKDKSCAYYETCFDLGVRLYGEHVPALVAVGGVLGKMIQVTDDLVDIMATPAKSDWWRCSNLSIFYMHQAASQDEWLLFNTIVEDIRGGGDTALIALRKAQTMLIQQGVLAYGLYLLESLRDEAFGLLAQTKLHDQGKIRELFDRQVAALAQLVA